MNASFIAAAGGIALVDMVLSGDNALVIGAAAGKLPRSQRLIAIAWGGLGAIAMRIALAIVATELLTVRYLQAFGGIILFFVAVRILLPEREDTRPNRSSDRLLPAIATILVADITMSLDNVLAVGALAAGNIPLLVGGLIFSMALLFVASTVVARLMDYFAWLLDAAAIVLAWTAANLVLEDSSVSNWLGVSTVDRFNLAVHFGSVALILVADLFIRAFAAHRARVRSGAGDPLMRDDGASSDHRRHPHSHYEEAGLDPAHLPHPGHAQESSSPDDPNPDHSPDSLRTG